MSKKNYELSTFELLERLDRLVALNQSLKSTVGATNKFVLNLITLEEKKILAYLRQDYDKEMQAKELTAKIIDF